MVENERSAQEPAAGDAAAGKPVEQASAAPAVKQPAPIGRRILRNALVILIGVFVVLIALAFCGERFTPTRTQCVDARSGRVVYSKTVLGITYSKRVQETMLSAMMRKLDMVVSPPDMILTSYRKGSIGIGKAPKMWEAPVMSNQYAALLASHNEPAEAQKQKLTKWLKAIHDQDVNQMRALMREERGGGQRPAGGAR